MTTLLKHLEQIKHLLPKAAELAIGEMQGGYTNRAYCLSWDNQPRLVMRVPALDEKVFGIHRFAEERALRAAEAVFLSPAILFCDAATGILVSRYVPQKVFDWSIVHKSSDIRRIATCLRYLHRLEDNGADYHLEDVFAHYWSQIRNYAQDASILSAELQWLECMVAPRLADVSPYKSCLCHNDLNPKNCLSDELHFWVIDWEYAGMGDPLFDLAIVAESHNLTDPQREVLVTHYDEKLPLKMTLMQLDRYQELYLLREMAWLLLKHVVTPDDLASLQCYYAFKDKLTQRLTPDSAGAAEQIAR